MNRAGKTPIQRMVFEQLERRVLLSADPAFDSYKDSSIETGAYPGADPEVVVGQAVPGAVDTGDAELQSPDRVTEVFFIDSRVPDALTLIEDLKEQEEQGFEIVLLEGRMSGIEQVGETLAQFRNLDAVHIISHGSDGALQLGSMTLDLAALEDNSEVIQTWGEAFAENGDLLFYGCDLAASANGQYLVDRIALLTGADVAASNDLTGSANLGGDWELEYATGDIESGAALSAQARANFDDFLAVETVRDEFNVRAYNNNDGTQIWTGDWTEIAEPTGSGVTNGPVQVSPNTTYVTTPNSLRVGGTQPSNPDPGFGVLREADLSVATSATLSFDYRRGTYGSPVATAGTLTLDVSDDGGSTWTTLQTYNFDATDASQTSESFDISANTASNTQIRFLTHGPVDDIVFFFDDIQIEYTTGPVNSGPTDLIVTGTESGGLSLNEDGGNDVYFVADDGGGLLGGLTALTVEALFSVDTPSVDNTTLLSYADGSNDEELAVMLKNDGTVWFLAHSNGTARQVSVNQYPQLLDGEIHHLGVSWDSTNGAVVLYVDGQQVESSTGYQTGQTLTGGGELIFGQDQDSVLAGFNTIDVFSGTLYDVRIFNDVRTPGEIAGNYGRTLPSVEPGMIANWQFDNLSASGVVTEVVGGNNLTEQHVGAGGGFSTSTPGLPLVVAEDAPDGFVIGTLSGVDPDVGDTLTYSLVNDAGGRFDIGPGSGVLTVQDGSLLNYGNNPSHTITVRVSDGSLDYVEVFTVFVTDIDRSPVNTVPAGQTVTEDATLIFNALNGNKISISEDNGESPHVILSVDNGTLTVSGAGGATVTGDSTSSVAISGSVADINLALDGLQYDPTNNYAGADTLTITTTDGEIHTLNIDLNLKGHYEFPSGDPGGDSSPGGIYDGTLNGGATIISDANRGDVLGLDGSNDHLAVAGMVTSGQQITLSGWVNLAAGATSAEVIDVTFNLSLRLDAVQGVQGSFWDGIGIRETSSGAMLAGTGWHHVAYTVDSTSNQQIIYVDGIAVVSSSHGGSIVYAGGDSNTYVGATQGSSNFFEGSIDDARVYDRVLTAVEIADLVSAPVYPSDTDTVSITVTAGGPALWLSSDEDSPSGADGLPGGWTQGEVLRFGGPDLAFGASTDGDFASVIDFDAFVVGAADTGALHFVSRNITVGSGQDSVDLRVGDVLVSFNQDEDVLAAFYETGVQTTVHMNDLLAFRPDSLGDYTSGTFYLLLNGVPDPLGAPITSLHGISLVEQNTTVGGTLLDAGTFLFAQQSGIAPNTPNHIYHFAPTSAGTASAAGTSRVLIDGDDINIENGSNIRGLELIETATSVGGMNFNAGDILVTLSVDDAVVGSAPTLNTSTSDIFVLRVGQAEPELGNTSAATAEMVFQGGDVNFTGSERVYAIALYPENLGPQAQGDRVGLSFDGVDDYVQIPDAPTLVMNNTLTMEAWVNLSTSASGGSQLIINKEGEYELGVTADSGEIKWAIAEGGTWAWRDTGSFINKGEWTHVAVTYNAGMVLTYINGALVHTYSQTGPIDDVYVGFNELRIGGRENATTQRFHGEIDEVRIWNVTRTEGEIKAARNSLLSGTEPGLVGNWRFDEGTGSRVFDLSPSGNDGTLGGVDSPAAEPSWAGYVTDEETLLTVPAGSGVLSNDIDADGDALTATNVDSTGMLGSLVVNADGSFSYDPRAVFDHLAPGQSTTESFSYTANDGISDSETATVTITVTGVNDPPPVSVTATNPTFSEGGAPVDLFDSVSVATVESGQGIDQIVFTVSNVTDGADEALIIDGTAVALTNANSGATVGNGYSYAVTLAGNMATVVLSTTAATPVAAQTVIDTLSYRNNSTPPTVANRVVTLLSVQDNGGIANGGADVNVLSISSTVGINLVPNAVSDADTAVEAGVNALGNAISNDSQGDAPATVTAADQGGNAITLGSAFSTANGGSLTLNSNGTYTYAPPALGSVPPGGLTEVFNYTITDADGDTSSAILTITVSDSDLLPSAVNDTNTAVEAGVNALGNVITNDTQGDAPATVTAADQGGTSITIGSAFGTANGGLLTLNTDGSYTYTPPIQGSVPPGGLTEVFNYTIADSDGDTSSATLTISVGDNDLAPSAVNDTDTATEAGANATGNVITNDAQGDAPATVTAADQGGTSITIGSAFATAGGGSLTLNSDGSYTYTPPAQGSVPPGGLTEVFSYTITDADGDTSSAILTITVSDNDLLPSAVNDTNFAIEAGVNATGNVITNDTQGDAPATVTAADQGGNAITLGSAFATSNGGSLTLNSDGSYSYTPPPLGSVPLGGLTEVFHYTLTDTDGDTASATLTITVSDSDLLPSAANDTDTAVEAGANATGNVITNDTQGDAPATVTAADQGGTSITIGSAFATANGGSLTLNSDGNYTYTPPPQGTVPPGGLTEVFTYTITDTDGDTSSAALTIAISDNNLTPSAVDDTDSTAEDTIVTTGNVLVNDTLGDAPATITAFDSTSANGGTVVNNGDGTFTYTPAANFNGTDRFTYTLTDNDGETATATVTITVSPVDDLPSAANDSASTDEDTAVTTGDVLSNDTLGDGPSTITAFDATSTEGGTVVDNGDGTFTYTPAADFSGTDAFTYTLTDADGDTSTATVTVTVSAVSEAEETDPAPRPIRPPSPEPPPSVIEATPPPPDAEAPGPQEPGEGEKEALLPESEEPSTRSGVPKNKTDEAEAPDEESEAMAEAAAAPAEAVAETQAEVAPPPEVAEIPIQVMRPPVSPSNTPPITGLRALEELPLMASPEFLSALDEIRSAVETDAPLDERQLQFVATGVTATGLSLTAGFVTWAIRGGSLLSALMAGIPAWKGFDPLPVVAGAGKRRATDEDDDKDKKEEEDTGTEDAEAGVSRLFETEHE